MSLPFSLHRLFVVCAALLLCLVRPDLCAAGELFVAFWNVENLFDTTDDPLVEGDEEFTPQGPKEWSQDRLEIKLDNLARVICRMNNGRGPDVLGLCEIENRAVVELLVAKLKPLKRDYHVLHKDSKSHRGIDVALIHDVRIAKLAEPVRFVDLSDLSTRDVLEAKLLTNNIPLKVFVNHWPSQMNPQEQRNQVASKVRSRLDALLKHDPHADILLMGDFNELPGSPAIGKTLRTWGDPKSLHPGTFFNSMWPLHSENKEGTYVYNNRWEVLDQVLLSPGMLDGKGVNWVPNSTQPMKEEFMLFKSRVQKSIPRPARTYTSNKFHSDGYSDHLPVFCRLSIN